MSTQTATAPVKTTNKRASVGTKGRANGQSVEVDPQIEEMELLHAIARKEHHAFHQLHQRFAGVIYSTVYKVLNDQQDTEDVVQEVLVQIWQKAHLYQSSKGRPLTWVATMARNRAIDRLRSKQRRIRLRDDFDQETESDEKVVSRDSSDAADTNERQGIVRSAVMELSKEQREAIEMAFFKGLTQSEVAEQLGEPLGTVKARIRRGIIRLKGIVSPRI